MIDDALTEHAANLACLASPRTPEDVETLSELMRKLVNGPLGGRGDDGARWNPEK
ncbi:hypothetical protein GCM10009850_059130 [Nonomuraea monospora]|uniref:Uncharacterized protein n=1 Tax=Nonomuraea monospora TaxID=568818 RepID=A0ABP5PFR1_9ACTN